MICVIGAEKARNIFECPVIAFHTPDNFKLIETCLTFLCRECRGHYRTEASLDAQRATGRNGEKVCTNFIEWQESRSGGVMFGINNASRVPHRLSDTSAPLYHNLSRKSKRRSNRRGNTMDAWNSGQQSSQGGVGYHQPRMLWPSSVPQNIQGSGQRLFTAMSDPSVCGYSAMPVTYTMQPVSLPPMYSLYQPVPLQNVRTVHHSTPRPVRSEHSTNVYSKASNSAANGCGNVLENGLESTVHIAHQNGDYASLPPNADSGVNGDELNSEHRRYSDPGLGPAKVTSNVDSDDSAESESSVITIGRTNKLALSLMEQVSLYNNVNIKCYI